MSHFNLLVAILGGMAVIVTSIGVVWRKVIKPLVDTAKDIKRAIDIFMDEFISNNGQPHFKQQFAELVNSNKEIANRVSQLESAQRENTAVVGEKLDQIGER